MLINLNSVTEFKAMLERISEYKNVEKAVKKALNMFINSPGRWDVLKCRSEKKTSRDGEFDYFYINIEFTDTESKRYKIIYTLNIYKKVNEKGFELKGKNRSKWSYQSPKNFNSMFFSHTDENTVKLVTEREFNLQQTYLERCFAY